ncbi:Thioredoxin [Penicillium macrosclerotiorum]|uniref:Thioredoxin n=1 Tax=Penicillium macrosclerotiorum TaxID=303699 RepID=UPI0025486576|nr:Thioredoxin [Penicillium macrosclerotiorum]KAJ5689051.1 Thioredoxin [Penicillium macrosclerotiorum]
MELSTLLIITALFIAFRIYQSRRAASTPIMSHGKVIDIDNDVIFKALRSTGPVFIDFYATWCGPCKAVAPMIGELSEQYENIRFLQVDVDKMRDIAMEYDVTAMPTFVLLKDGEPVGLPIKGANLPAIKAALADISA